MQSGETIAIEAINQHRKTPDHSTSVYGITHSTDREIRHVALAISNPLRLDDLLSLSIQVLVGCADSTITDTSDRGDLLRRLGRTEEVGGHVDACGGYGQRRTTGEITDGRHLLSQGLGDLLEYLVIKTKLTAEPNA